MKTRRETILTQVDVSTAGTKPIDIVFKDPISRLYVKYNHTNGSHAATAHPAKCVSKIELVKGSTVLASLSGMQAEALNFFDTGECRGRELEYRNGCVGEMLFPLNFGRFLWDTQLALLPVKFPGLQLKISHNSALGGSAPSSATLEVFADLFDQNAINPIGFLRNQVERSYSLANDATEPTDLPVDHVLRRVMILSLAAAKELDDQLSTLELNEDGGKRKPVEMNISDLMRFVAQKYGPYIEHIVGCSYRINADDWYITPSNKANVMVSPLGDGKAWTAGERMGGYTTIEPSAVTVWRLLSSGFEPHGAIALDFGDPAKIEDWYDLPGKVGNLKLKLKAGSSVGSGSTCEIVTQQLWKY